MGKPLSECDTEELLSKRKTLRAIGKTVLGIGVVYVTVIAYFLTTGKWGTEKLPLMVPLLGMLAAAINPFVVAGRIAEELAKRGIGSD